jgi:hypothetical protein
VPHYEYALELLLDADAADEVLTDAQQRAVEAAAESLYGALSYALIDRSRQKPTKQPAKRSTSQPTARRPRLP